MRRFERYASCVLVLTSVLASACRGQNPGSEASGDVDPALVAMVDSMLPRLEVLAGLKKLKPVALAEQSRSDLRKYVEQRLAEEMPPAEMEGIRQTYVQLGLMPDTLDIRALLLDLYQEQVAGYYDPTSEKFYVITGTPVSLLTPVLAHELVHALQDQHANLDSLISRTRGNDRQSAAQAAIEGHATMVMFAYLTQQATRGPLDPATLPDVGAQLRPALETQNSQFPVFKRAPRIIRETLVFPYVAGATFVQKLWKARRDDGFPAPFGSLMPQSTEQVMHADDHFLTNRDEPTEIRFANTKNVLYESTLGEEEMSVFLVEHLGRAASAAAAGWDGDRYQLLQLNGKKVLVWQSIWDNEVAADRFAEAYRQIAARRTDRVIRVERNVVRGRQGVLVFDGEAGSNVKMLKAPTVRLLP